MNFIHHPDPIKFLLEAGNDQIENTPEFCDLLHGVCGTGICHWMRKLSRKADDDGFRADVQRHCQ
jgi:hypothetical protein